MEELEKFFDSKDSIDFIINILKDESTSIFRDGEEIRIRNEKIQSITGSHYSLAFDAYERIYTSGFFDLILSGKGLDHLICNGNVTLGETGMKPLVNDIIMMSDMAS